MTVLVALVALPIACGVLAFIPGWSRARPWMLPVVGIAHFGLACEAIALRGAPGPDAWIALDALGAVVLGIVSAVFLACSFYAPGYLAIRADRPNRLFCACLPAMLGCATLLILAQHLGLLWVAMELTTLAAAPLIYFNRTALSIEATWKYLVIGSVGVALALLGSFFLAYAAHQGGVDTGLDFASLAAHAPAFSKPWVRAAFVLLLVGFGTKMGLVPLHTWKPDAYGEAPGLVGALLAGGLTNCAFLALLRVHRVVVAAGEGIFAGRLLVGMGLLSMTTAAVFMIRQRDFKRLLAYSSVEHMGILALGIGIGGAAAWGALLHAINNALVKCVVFLAAANIHRAYGSKNIEHVAGAMRRLPITGALFLAAFFAITGSPPFGIFFSELTILVGAFQSARPVLALAFLAVLGAIYIGMGATFLAVVQRRDPHSEPRDPSDTLLRNLPLLLALAPVVILGLWIPEPLRRLLAEAASGL